MGWWRLRPDDWTLKMAVLSSQTIHASTRFAIGEYTGRESPQPLVQRQTFAPFLVLSHYHYHYFSLYTALSYSAARYIANKPSSFKTLPHSSWHGDKLALEQLFPSCGLYWIASQTVLKPIQELQATHSFFNVNVTEGVEIRKKIWKYI